MADEAEPTEIKTPSSRPAGPEASRFTPGAMLADRFRIIALLGKGGMGEVYRAEDVKLGQQVALKFLPVIGGGPARRDQLFSEVRLGRQVSHPNVCRVYDVMEADGLHFISMEYIDGEDLASLLRRIGRLPPAKALDMARDVCAGLAAAHAVGIVHRDLKPANVMIDGRGTARITDFGLAAVSADAATGREIAGTPAYMAPEQLTGGEVTQRTDIYALGLILFEMFTGKRRFEGSSIADLIAQHESSRSHSLSEATRDVDPAAQRVIMRCLEEKPESRPSSIHAVIAALPGGDPLQAALDAGETPSPEMVAAAGETGSLRPAIGLALLIATIVLILINAAISKKAMLYGRADLPKKPDVLADRAREILSLAGLKDTPADTAFNLGWNNDYFESDRANREDVNAVRPSPIVFYYRESPRELVALQSERRITAYDPPPTLSRMANVEIDATGRLIRFTIVPPEVTEPRAQTSSPDWLRFISEAGIDPASLKPVPPVWRSPVDSDQRMAWEARYPAQSETTVRVEAASYRGSPVWFAVIPPWQQADRTTYVGAPPSTRLGQIIGAAAGLVLAWGAIYLAVRNVRRSRGDRRGALRIALALMAIMFAARALRVDHVWDIADENAIITQIMSEAVLIGVMAWLIYLAIEPFFRRRWPRLLIAWTRLLGGRFRDPMVGRDILIGAAAGSGIAVASKLAFVLPVWSGQALPAIRTYFTALTEMRHLGYLMLNNLQLAIVFSLSAAFLYLLFHLMTRNAIVTWMLLAVGLTLLNMSGGPPPVPAAIMSVALAAMFQRYGLLALTSMYAFSLIIAPAPTTLDTSVWYFGRSFLVMALMAGLAAAAFWTSLAAQPIFNLALLEED